MTGLHAARILLRSVNFVLVMQHPCSQDLSPLDPNLWSICIELEGSSFSVVDRYSGDCCRSYDAVPMLWPYQFPECGRHWCPSCWRSSENMCLGVSDVWLCKIKCWKSVFTSRNIYIYMYIHVHTHAVEYLNLVHRYLKISNRISCCCRSSPSGGFAALGYAASLAVSSPKAETGDGQETAATRAATRWIKFWTDSKTQPAMSLPAYICEPLHLIRQRTVSAGAYFERGVTAVYNMLNWHELKTLG